MSSSAIGMNRAKSMWNKKKHGKCHQRNSPDVEVGRSSAGKMGKGPRQIEDHRISGEAGMAAQI